MSSRSWVIVGVAAVCIAAILAALRLAIGEGPRPAETAPTSPIPAKSERVAAPPALERPPDAQPQEVAEKPRSEAVEKKAEPEPAPAPDFREVYQNASLEVLVRERDALKAGLAKHTTPLLEQRMKNGQRELVSAEREYSEQPRDETEIFSLLMVPGEGTYRTALPRSDYPEFYAIKDQIRWLDARIAKLEVDKALAERSEPR